MGRGLRTAVLESAKDNSHTGIIIICLICTPVEPKILKHVLFSPSLGFKFTTQRASQLAPSHELKA